MLIDEKGFSYCEPNKAREKERRELLAMSDAQASTLSDSMQYQRMRYQREIEGMEFVRKVQDQARQAREQNKQPEFPKATGVRSTIYRKEWKGSGSNQD